jgi:hypothetical protein
MITARVRSELNYEISVSGFYEAHTIEKLSNLIQNTQASETEAAAAKAPEGTKPSEPEEVSTLSPEAEENLKLSISSKRMGSWTFLSTFWTAGNR